MIPLGLRAAARDFREWLVRCSGNVTLQVGPARVDFFPAHRPEPPPPSELALRARGEQPPAR